jgi:23S rRNA (guanine745-N1)-methyltransferase
VISDPLSVPLACTVRGCGLPLRRNERALVCGRGHAYDIARRGYVNLLQPQDRKSRVPGDSKAALAARARLLAAGVGAAVVEACLARADVLIARHDSVVCDLGCGSGDLLGALATRRPIAGVGIDLSLPAIEHAARRFPDLDWVVANADRHLPLLSARVSLLFSLHARRNPAESARVLEPGGFLLMGVPAPDDLLELRTAIQGQPWTRNRMQALLAEHTPFFTLVDRWTTRTRQPLAREQILDLLVGTYRGVRTAAAGRAAALGATDVTLASEFVVFRRS